MSEVERHMRIESIEGSGSCLRLEPVTGFESRGGAGAGTGISSITVETIEATPATAFWGTVASCNLFDVIIRRRG